MSETPKTPGGISKTLLTPCRRVGLSRKWKKSCTSPFISPLNIENSTPRTETKQGAVKRKQIPHDTENIDEQIINNYQDNIVLEDSNTEIECDKVITTPSRPIQLLKKKKSRISVLTSATESTPECATETLDDNLAKQSESKSQITNDDDENSASQDIISDETPKVKDKIENPTIGETEEPVVKLAVKKTSKKVTKKKSGELSIKGSDSVSVLKPYNSISQNLLDTPMDDTSLSHNTKFNNLTTSTDLPYDQVSFNKMEIAIVKNLEDKKTSTGDLKKYVTHKFKKDLVEATLANENNLSQISITSLSDEDDDFDLEKKTILVRRSYYKTAKPIKCKSTGSITQKDIDKLRKRIEMKKQQLRAKTNTAETKDLTDLIKKWRKGSHDALNELMELMKLKMPDKHNMDLSELLEMLKIPPDLVGYDVEHDCFKNEIDLV